MQYCGNIGINKDLKAIFLNIIKFLFQYILINIIFDLIEFFQILY